MPRPDSPPAASAAPGAAPPEEPVDLVTLDEIRAAASRLVGVALRTPLLAAGTEPRLLLKPESLQPVGAFKIRGAYNAIATLPPDRRGAGVVTHSSGNHAQGVARAARLLGTRAVIVMPSDAPALKVARVRADGAEIVTVGPSSEERARVARELAEAQGLTLVPPYDDRAVICGQGTVGLEIAEDLAGEDSLTVLVPIGGGGLAAGVSTAIKTLMPRATVIGVEPALAADARESLMAGRLVRWPPEQVGRTIADGMRTTSVGRIPFAHLERYLDVVVTVEEEEIARAMAWIADEARLVVEPSGATAVAAALFHSAELPDRGDTVAVLSGGNVDPERYAALVAWGRGGPPPDQKRS